MAKPKPPVSLLWEKYSYNPFTGRFHSIDDDYEYRGNFVGTGGKCHQLSITSIHRYPYGVCVFAWLYGRWPIQGMHIDHINYNPFDHRMWNIRELNNKENITRRRRTGTVPGRPRNRKQGVGTGRWRETFKAPTFADSKPPVLATEKPTLADRLRCGSDQLQDGQDPQQC